MIVRIYEPSAKFGIETIEYHDYECDDWQLHSGVLQLMRFKANDLHIPLTSIKLFEQLGKKIMMPARQTPTDSQMGLFEHSGIAAGDLG